MYSNLCINLGSAGEVSGLTCALSEPYSQDDEYRKTVGLRGGIEALFLLCEKVDEVTQANSLWALGNLAWQPHNQVGRAHD